MDRIGSDARREVSNAPAGLRYNTLMLVDWILYTYVTGQRANTDPIANNLEDYIGGVHSSFLPTEQVENLII